MNAARLQQMQLRGVRQILMEDNASDIQVDEIDYHSMFQNVVRQVQQHRNPINLN